MNYYFDTPEQIKGDKAYNKGDYEKALRYYSKAYTELQELFLANKQNKKIPYPLAYVLCEMAYVKALMIGSKASTEQEFKQVCALEQEVITHLEEVSALIGTSLKGEQKTTIVQKSKEIQIALLEQSSVAYWNRAQDSISIEYNSLEEKITHSEHALELVEQYLQQVQSLDQLDENDHAMDYNATTKFHAELYELLSDYYGEQGDLVELTSEERIVALKYSKYYSQKALAEQQKIAPANTQTPLHLTYLNIQENLFKLTQDQAHLQEITNYINSHLSSGIFTPEEQFEIKAYQFLVASQTKPTQRDNADILAKELVALGRFEDSPVLAVLYDNAQSYLQTSLLASNLMFFAKQKPEPAVIENKSALKRKHEEEEQETNVKKISLATVSIDEESTEAQPQIDCLMNTVAKLRLSKRIIATLLAITADFHTTQRQSAAVMLSRDELYNTALSFTSDDKLRALILAQQATMYETNALLFKRKKHTEIHEQIEKPYAITTHEGLLGNFRHFFEAHIIQVEAFYLNHAEVTNNLFSYITKTMDRRGLVSKVQANELTNALAQAMPQDSESPRMR